MTPVPCKMFGMSNKIKSTHLTSVHELFDVRISQECETLAEAGYEVVLIVPHDNDVIVNGVRIRAVPKPKGRMERMTRTSWQVFRKALEEDATLFHIHDPELLPWAQVLRLMGKHVVYDMHENVPKAILTKPWINPSIRFMASKLFRLLERILIWKMPVIYAEDSYPIDYPFVRNKAVVLNMPRVDKLPSLSQPKYSRPTIGYIGDVTAERGSLVVLEALQILKLQGCAVNWECIGPMDETHNLEFVNFVDRQRLEGIHLHGFMVLSKGLQIIARCHIGIAVLQPIPNYVQSYPTKMFEYMALGLPVIVSDFPLYRKVVEENQIGLCVNPQDPNEVARAIRWLVEHPGEAEDMGKRGQELVLANYNWACEGQKLKSFFIDQIKGNHMSR